MRFEKIQLRAKGVLVLAITTLTATIACSAAFLPAPLTAPQVLAQSVSEQKAEADRLLQQGAELYRVSQFEAASQSWEQALIIYRKIKVRELEFVALGLLGIIYSHKGLQDYSKAIEYYQQALTIAQEIKEPEGEVGVLGSLGIAYYHLGNYPKAIEYQQQRLALGREIKDRQGEISALGELGIIYQSLGDYLKAIVYPLQVLEIARSIQDLQSEAAALGNLGIAYFSLRDYPKAIDYAQQHLALALKIKDPLGAGNAIATLGAAYYKLGDYPKAIEYYQGRLEIARLVKDRRGESDGLGKLGLVYYSLGDYPKAIEFYQQALTIAREIKDPQYEASYLNNLGLTLYKQGNFTLAESTLFEGINVLETLRVGLYDSEKVSIIDTQGNTYYILQQVLIAQNKTDAALEISEAGRSRAFVDVLSRKISPNAANQLTAAKLSLKQIKEVAKTQNATLIQYSLIYDDFKVGNKQQTQLSELYIWVIKPTGEIAFRAVDLKSLWQKQNTSLKELVDTTRASIGVDDRSMFSMEVPHPVNKEELAKSLKQLHQILIAPIADLLPSGSNQRVIFMPQNELFLVPFPALQDAQGKYLIEKHTISTSPAIQVLELTHERKGKVKLAAATDAIVLGNPTMPSVAPKIGEKPQQLASLPGSKREAEAIAPLLNTKALTGNAATKAAVLARLPQAKIVHLATHGLFDSFQGLQSAIALAPTSSDSGLLTAEEILNLKLNADLVVLSACNTGRGRITGDGVIGLSRSLFIAGTPSVIVSLWSVPDTPTAELMTEFYTNLNQKKLDKAQSLRQAMLKVMGKNPDNPKAWAAFTLLGEAE